MVRYTSYGIDPELVKLAKKRLKNRAVKEQLFAIWGGVTKADLQDEAKVIRLLAQAAKAAGIRLTTRQSEAVTAFVLSQQIDPGNPFHLIRLWAILR